MKYRLILLIILSLLLVGCNSKDYTVYFKDEMVIDYNSNDSPLLLIDRIGDTKITEEMIENNSIVIDNFKISCAPVDTKVEKNYLVVYKTNDTELSEYKKQIFIKDISAPEIVLKTKEVTILTDQIKSLDLNKYISVKDNFDQSPTIHIESDKTISKAGTYTVSINAEDINKNKSEAKLNLIVKDKSTQKETSDDQKVTNELPKNKASNNSKANSNNSNTSSTKKSTQEKSNSYSGTIKKRESKQFLFGNVYQLNGQNVVCNMENAIDLCKQELRNSGISGEYFPILKNNITIGMQVNFF